MGTLLANEVMEELLDDIKSGHFSCYLDTWEYEDEYSHNIIDNAREKFIEMANNYFIKNGMNYEAREVVENVYIFDKTTKERVYK